MSNDVERPTGETFIVSGWLSLVGSAIAGIYGMLEAEGAERAFEMASGPSSYLAADAGEKLAQAAYASTVSWALFYLFLVLIPTGYIIRAISFLPGRDDSRSLSNVPHEAPAKPSDAQLRECDWCGLGVAAPFLPCSALAVDDLNDRAQTVKSEVCRAQLKERGHIGS